MGSRAKRPLAVSVFNTAPELQDHLIPHEQTEEWREGGRHTAQIKAHKRDSVILIRA